MTHSEPLNRRRPQPRPYQTRISRKLDENWQTMSSQLIVAPTGAGKTFMALAGARRFVNEIAPAKYGVKPEEVGVFWMAMRRNLFVQTDRANREFFENEDEEFFCPNLHFVSSFSRTPNAQDYKIRLLVGDEAHHSATASEASVLEFLNPDATIGLSATPDRHDRAQLHFQTIIKDAGYRTLIKEGWLSQFRHYSMEQWSPEVASQTYAADPERFGKTLFFYRTFEECEQAKQMLAAHGHEVDIVHGGADRDAILNNFLYGSRKALISMAILAEGFDAPELETVFVRDTQSSGLATQMAGRVLRLHNAAPIKNIVQSVHCAHPFLREAAPIEQYIQRGNKWVSLLPSERAMELMGEVNRRMAMALTPPQLPDWTTVRRSLKFHQVA